MKVSRRSPWIRWSLTLGPWALLAAVIGGSTTDAFDSLLSGFAPEDPPRVATVRRMNLDATLVAGGILESATKTLIECELEGLVANAGGSSISMNGSSTIIEIVADGTDVKKGDVLCRLDDSGYEELIRLQRIQVEGARAAQVQAELAVEVAETALREYQDGLRRQYVQDYKGRIALAQADLKRGEDRLDWTTRMHAKGYASAAQIANDKATVMRARFLLGQLEREYQNFLKFGDKTSVTLLENQLESARVNQAAGADSLKIHEGRLAHYREQLERCTIRAPHDGFVVYAHDDDDDERIDVGLVVRRKKDLFHLPDLEQLEVHTRLHESVVDRVREGMAAEVRVEAFSDTLLTGRVGSISWLPVREGSRWASSGIMNFLARVKLDSVPAGLRPGMSAEVRINLGARPDVLAIPPEAVAYEDGREVCYVATPSGVERREVVTVPAEIDLVEVAEGLEEGEKVLLGPSEVTTLGAG
ncbi:MAG: efflux RND transporter periplasmic adaptor subunit [Isosphaeraceae bacterium]